MASMWAIARYLPEAARRRAAAATYDHWHNGCFGPCRRTADWQCPLAVALGEALDPAARRMPGPLDVADALGYVALSPERAAVVVAAGQWIWAWDHDDRIADVGTALGVGA